MANRREGSRSVSDRPTKADRKDEARRKRLEIERRMARARRNRRIAVAVAVALVAALAAFAASRPKPEPASVTKLLAAAPAAERTAGCTTVQVVGAYQPESLDRAHIGAQGGPATMPALSSYPSVPPASGPHSATPLPAGVYSSPPAIDQAIHSLEHGAAILWYDPSASAAELSKIQAFFRDPAVGSRVIVAPYDYPDQGEAGHLPAGAGAAFVAWHHLETCAQLSLPAAVDFAAHYGVPTIGGGKYLGDAPEPGAPI